MPSEHMPPSNGWKFRGNWIFIGFFLIAGFFLLTEHRAHLFGWLPFILLALCLLMHFFGHEHSVAEKEKRK